MRLAASALTGENELYEETEFEAKHAENAKVTHRVF